MTTQTEHHQLADSPFRLGEWLVEPRLNRLTRGGETIQLELKVMDVLVCLAERAGEVVLRRDIVDRVWATEFIADNTLTHAITDLRNAFGDHARTPTFIETIHGRGYRLIAPVVVEERASATVTRFPVPKAVAVPADRSPYPGLAAFTEKDAEFFFGREAEVAKMWRKITSRRLLAVIGPSGVGKSSFLRAGVIPAKPDGWGVLVCQPGETPFGALARALVPEFAGDIEATSQLVDIRGGDRAVAVVSRWRDRSHQALLIIDQFEELFTQNTAEVQRRFAGFLRKAADSCDVHVVVALRDDFLFRVHDHRELTPLLDELTLLGAPAPDAMWLALVEPARRLGFAFENENLPGEMIGAVEGERGALPLLAFAIARLWDERDRERRLLTSQAYKEIGGVGGALGQHAETTLKAIGDDRIPIVREIFRNLVTAEGTRAVREVGELLSVFPDSKQGDAEEVLRRLVDARLLTSFEEEGVEGEGRRRVEVVHESLLTSWPRLVRWRTQDADAAQLRDQLRQAAKTWDEHGRTDDTLWTGAAYREFASWRERYPGGLTNLEEAFTSAMTSFATRRRRRRRIAAAAAVVMALVVATVFALLWRRSVLGARRAEAQKLLALAQVELDTSPTEALVYATASLELTDTEQARRMVLGVLTSGPPATLLVVRNSETGEGDVAHDVGFSPDGGWAAFRGFETIRVVSRDGAVNCSLEPLPRNSSSYGPVATFDPVQDRLIESRWNIDFRIWSIPNFTVLENGRLPEVGHFPDPTLRGLYMVSNPPGADETVVRLHATGGEDRMIGRIEGLANALGATGFLYAIDREGRWFAYARRNEIYVRSLENWDLPERRIGKHQTSVVAVGFAGERVAAESESGELWIWPIEGDDEELGPFPIRERGHYFIEEGGEWLGVYRSQTDFSVEVWDLRTGRPSPAPRYRFPALVHAGDASANFNGAAFVPGGRWVATAHVGAVAFWPLRSDVPRILAEEIISGTHLGVRDLEFTPDGRQLLALVLVPAGEAEIRVWDLDQGGPCRTLASTSIQEWPQLAVDPRGRYAAVTAEDAIELIPLAGGSARRLEGYSPGTWVFDLAFDDEGRRLAACVRRGPAEDKVIRIWDLETGEVTVLGPIEGAGDGYEGGTSGLRFLPDGLLISSGRGGLRLWDVGENSCEVVIPADDGGRVAAFGRQVASVMMNNDRGCTLHVVDSQSRNTEILPSRFERPFHVSTDPMGVAVVSAERRGSGLQVGPISGGVPHLLLGHERGINGVAVSPDGRWIASAGQEGSIRLWPMPDLSTPPLDVLPRDKLIAKLKSLTNLRAVRDEESSTGWKIEVRPFLGWETVPTW